MRPAIFGLCLLMAGCESLRTPPAPPPPPKLAFVYGGEIFLVDAMGQNRRLLVGDLEHDRPLTFSPDGRTLLYWKHSDIGWDIWATGLEASKPVNLTQVKTGGCRSPAFSPDGRQIAFMRDNPRGLYVMNADGSEARRISEFGHRDDVPAWSADGTRIAVSHLGRSEDGKIRSELVVVAADGSDEVQFTPTTGTTGDSLTWSPNGRWIYFRGRRNDNSEIGFLDPDTGVEVNLTETPEDEHYPVLSPDGRTFAFIVVDEDERRLTVMQSDGEGPRVLATFEGRSTFPTWAPDGTEIAYMVHEKDDVPRIRAVGLNGDNDREIGIGSFPAWRPVAKNRP